MKKTGKRLGALLLALVMVLSLLPMSAFAARMDDTEVAIEAPEAGTTAAQTAELPTGAVDDVPAQLLEGETPEYTLENIHAGLFDVGYNGTEYSNPATGELSGNDVQGTVITASAFSSNGGSNQDSGPGWAVVSGFDPTSALSNSHMVWHSNYSGESNWENRWFQLTITDGPVWLNGLRYYPKKGDFGGNGAVTKCDVRVSETGEDGSWTSVVDGNYDWTSSSGNWRYKAFSEPVQAKYIRFYGYESVGNFMNAAAVRLVKASSQNITEDGSVTITVKDYAGTSISGATVSIKGSEKTTDSNGQATFENLKTAALAVTVTKDSKTNTAMVTPASGGAQADIVLAAAGDIYSLNTHLENAVSVEKMTVTAASNNPINANKTEGGTDLAIDGNAATTWHTNYGTNSDDNPTDVSADNGAKRYIQIQLESETWVTGLAYWPFVNGGNGWVRKYDVQASSDGTNWASVQTGPETGTWEKTQTWLMAEFAPVKAQYIRLRGLETGGAAGSGDGKGQYMTAAEIRVIQAANQSPDVHSATITVSGVETTTAVTVKAAGQTVTGTGNDNVTIPNLVDGQTYTVTVTAEGYVTGTTTVTGGNSATATVELLPYTNTLTGKITTDGSTAVVGATVCLVNTATSKTVVADTSVSTEQGGTFSLSVADVADGTYYLRAYKAGHGANIFDSKPITVSSGQATSNVVINAVLPAIAATADTTKEFTYDMSAGNQPTLEFVKGSDGQTVSGAPTANYPDGQDALQITFTNYTRENNLVKLKGTGVKNGIIEFDATRSGTGANRFGLAFRLTDNSNWIYIGQENANDNWGYEFWGTNGSTYSYGKMGPRFASGDTRHFKVQIKDLHITLWIDGIQVINMDMDNRAPDAAADVGFICGNEQASANSIVTIDNLYVYREDPAYAVSVITGSGAPALTAKIVDSAAEGGVVDLLTGDKAAVGDVVRITATDTSTTHALNRVTVTKADNGTVTVPVTNEGEVFSFTMPAYNVNVTGALLPKVTGVEVPSDAVMKVGKELTVTAKAGDESVTTGFVYQWSHENTEESGDKVWVACTNDGNNTATKKFDAYDNGKRVKVVVTGDGQTIADTVSFEKVLTGTVAPADIEITGFGTHRNSITMIKNGDANDTTSDNTTIGGTTTTLELSLNPALQENQSYEPYTITWGSSNESAATVAAVQDNNLQATLTAVGTGDTTITATLSRDGKDDITATCTVTVKNKATGVTVKKNGTAIGSDPIVIYANATDNSVVLTGEVTPEGTGIDNKTLNWFRPNGATGKVTISRNTENGQCTISASEQTATNIGQVTVWASVGDQSATNAVHKEFTVEVRRKLANDISINGELKVGSTLSANTSALTVLGSPDSEDADSGKNKLTYQWYRLENSTDTPGDSNKITNNGTGKEYLLTADDYNKYIAVVVTATPNAQENFFYEGSKQAVSSAQVAVKDGPVAPTGLGSTNCTTDANNNGTITGLTANTTYDIQKKNGDNWELQTPVTTNNDGEIENLANGDYQVRVPADDTNHVAAGAWSTTMTILANGANAKSITIATGIEHGEVSTQRNQVEKEQTVTITVTPATGYQLKTLTVTKDGVSGEDATVQVNMQDYTFTMPDNNVTISAEFEPVDLTITHALTNLTCNLGTPSGEQHTHTVKYGTEQVAITLSVSATGYVVPTDGSSAVTKTQGGELATDYFTYTYAQDRQTATITFPHGIQDNLTITLAAVKRTYTVSYALTNGLSSSIPAVDARNATHGEVYNTTISAAQGYSLPQTITITRQGTDAPLTQGTDYTYSQSNGAIQILATATTAPLTITAVGVKNTTPINSATISNVAMVGNQLSVTVDPAGATADYQWQMSDQQNSGFADISGATGQTFNLTEAQKGKYVRVVLTGKGDYSGTKESNAVGPVAAKVVAATGVTINGNASVVFGQTLTLTATITPNETTETTVKWSVSSGADVVEINADTGVVTPKKVGSAQIRAAVMKADGTTESATNTKDITVTPAALGNVSITGVLQAGQTVTVQLPTGVTSSDIHRIAWYSVGAGEEGSDLLLQGSTSTTYTLTDTNAGHKLKVSVEAEGNYTGTKDFTTTENVASSGTELPSYTVTVNQAANGSVTADKTSAKQGETVTLTVTPESGYKLDALSVKDADNADVEVVNNAFTMPGKNVTVTATFVADSEPEVDKAALTAAIDAAKAAKEGVMVTDKAANAVEKDTHYVTTAQDTALTTAITTAQAVLDKTTATQTEVDEAVTALNSAVTTFNTAKDAQVGTMDDAELVAAITAARTAKAAVNVLPDETTAADVKTGVKFVTKSEMAAFDADIKAAETALNAADKDQTTLDAAKGTLIAATTAFTDVTTKTGTNDDAEAPVVDTAALDDAIEAANAAKTGVVIGTDPAQVNSGTKFVAQDVMDALDAVIAAANTEKNDENKTDGSVSNAVDALNAAVEDFKAAIQTGTKSTSRPSSGGATSSGSTTTETKEDGTKVTTETKPDGTKVVTTETPDGAKEVVETKKDGTVTATTETPDGTKAVVETKPDGSKTQTVEQADGTKSEMEVTKDGDVTITVTDAEGEELVKTEIPAEIPEPETKFEDVSENHWAADAINKVAGLELVNGTGDNKYSPVAPMTRGSLATVLHRLSQGKTDYEMTFKDVAEGKYYTEGVAWAAKANVVKGVSEDVFAPDKVITREQLAVMLARYAKLVGLNTKADAKTLESFTDGDTTGVWAVEGMAWCVENGILKGKGQNNLDPTADVTRAEVAVMLDRFIALLK